MVGTDNRLLASSGKFMLHDALDTWISSAQKGFLTGRRMNSNILEMDTCSKLYTLQQDEPALVFFDFKAAFPSVSHHFLWHALGGLGIPPKWVALIKLFYRSNLHIVGRDRVHSFLAAVGIRQGCPLSPLVFAVVADILLRRVSHFLQDKGMVRAFAVDTAVLLKCWGI